MRTISLRVVVGAADPAVAFTTLADFERFPGLAEDIHFVRTHPAATPGQPRHSEWAVNFRRGIMRWTERETLDPAGPRIDFDQTDGDFAEFHGGWRFTPTDVGTEILFTVTYDFGIESLAGIMDPIAERVMKRAVCVVLVALFGPVSVREGGAALSDLGGVPNIPGVIIMSIGESDGCAQPVRLDNDLSPTEA